MNNELYKHLVNKVESGVISQITENNSLSLKLEHKFNLLSAEYDNKYNSLYIKLEDKINSLNIKVDDKTCIDLNNDNIINDNNENLNVKINSKRTTDVSLKDINSNYDYKNDILITTLKDEIKFLRNELRSKDKIIELIVKELPVGYKRSVSSNEGNDYKTSSKRGAVNNNNNKNNNTLPLHNKFTPLVSHNDDDDVNEVQAGSRAIPTASKTKKNKGNKTQDDVIHGTVHGKRKEKNSEMNAKSKSNKRTINFIGGSLLKGVNPYNLKHTVKKSDKLYVQSYRGARTSAMKHHAKASQEYSSNIYLVHAGTNDLKLQKTPGEIADDILEIGSLLKNDDNQVFISSILTRRDNLKEKGK